MFANRFTALIDACSLVDSLKRNILLSLADAGFYRIRWSDTILEETERAILSIRQSQGVDDPYSDARRARVAMETAFPEATVAGFDDLLPCVVTECPIPMTGTFWQRLSKPRRQ